MSFDDMLPPATPGNNPKGMHPYSGKREDVINTIAFEHIKSKNNKPYSNVLFKGVVVYTAKVTPDELYKRYDPSFMMYMANVLKISTKPTEHSAWKKVGEIVEAIVYIPEISAVLPQPEDTSKFFKEVAKATKKPKKGKEEEEYKKSQKKITLTKREIAQMERFPRAYYVAESQKKGDKKKNVVPQSIVEVQFPYSFDFSYGVITGVSSS